MILYDSRRVSSYAGVGVSNSFVAVTFVLVQAFKSPQSDSIEFSLPPFSLFPKLPKILKKLCDTYQYPRYIIQSFNLFDYYIKYLKLFSIKIKENFYINLIIRLIQLYNNRKQ